MSTDIFVRTRTNNPIRLAIADAAIMRLKLLEGVKTRFIGASGFPLPATRAHGKALLVHPDQYHVDSRWVAHEAAKSDVYVVIDDDCLPLGRDWLERGLAAMAAWPQFAALASWSINGEIDPAKCALPSPGEPWESDLFEVESLGTPTFLRRSTQLLVPEGSLGQYDATLSAAYREHGRIGMMRYVRHNHLGYGLSEVVPEWWLA